MPTKAQLEAQIETMREEHAEEVALLNHQMETFRKKVVRVARANARKHEWCEVVDKILVDKMGLADIMPDHYAIEYLYKDGRRSRWLHNQQYTTRRAANEDWQTDYMAESERDPQTYRLVQYKADGTLVKVLAQVH